jgi:hypothetical protein
MQEVRHDGSMHSGQAHPDHVLTDEFDIGAVVYCRLGYLDTGTIGIYAENATTWSLK